MTIYTALKKYAKRKAGCWGRVNHKRDMRAASKALRKQGYEVIDLELSSNGEDNETR